VQSTQQQGTYQWLCYDPPKTVIFIKASHHRATAMGWNQGTRQITMFTNSARRQVDIIKSYSQINKAILKTACERFCKPG
jgi:hypothetical protein